MSDVQRLVILPNEQIGRIHPHLHGHFAEHLGELVYNGVWVDPDGPIPNRGGLRLDVLEALRPLEIPVLRWPGGCFADDYHWRDGVGRRADRPLRLNRHWGMAPEPNHFGTHEFVEFCRALGAEPYFAANLGSGTPTEMSQWVEYCNHEGDSTLSRERRANGEQDPFRIRYWGIGNENWGCGGHLSPEHYAEEYCRFRTFLSEYPNSPVEGIACGPNNADWDWTRRFFTQLKRGWSDRTRLAQGFAAHYYCGTAGSATEYDTNQWYELLSRGRAVDGVIAGHRALMDEFDPERRVKLILDEWGTWHPVEPGKPRSGLYQQNTIRDACVAALSLDVFHDYADALWMANIAQLVNVLQSLLLVQGDRCIKTPTYHVFDLYRPHQGATAVRLLSAADTVSDGGGSAGWCRTRYLPARPFALRAVDGSASVVGGRLCVTMVNTNPVESVEAELHLHGASFGEAEWVYLAGADYRDHNTFEQPDRVRLSAPRMLRGAGDRMRIQLPPASVSRVRTLMS